MVDRLVEVGLLCVEGRVEEVGRDTALGLDTSQHFVVNTVEKSRHRAKDGRLQFSNIIQQFESVALEYILHELGWGVALRQTTVPDNNREQRP